VIFNLKPSSGTYLTFDYVFFRW